MRARGLFVGTQPTGAHEKTTSFALQAGQSLEVSPAKADRSYLMVQNRGQMQLFFAVNRPANSNDHVIEPGDYLEPINPPRGSINIYAPAAGAGVVSDG